MADITIIIPCYNASRYIEETIQSVKKQDTETWECIIVDDCSSDDSIDIITEAIAGDSRFRLISLSELFNTKDHFGVAVARNAGIARAVNEYILPLDADDLLLPNAIREFSHAADIDPNAALIIPRIRRFGDCAPIEQDRQWYCYEDLKYRCTPSNTSLFRWRDWFHADGYHSGTMYEDWEFWLRLLYNNSHVVNIPKVLVEYRIHKDSRWHDAVRYHDREVSIIRNMNPKIYGDKVIVAIPYLAKGAQGNELELAVKGWRKFFKEPYQIVIIGDYHPICSDPDITFIECPRVSPIPGQYLPHIDHVNKFRKLREHFPLSRGFVYTCDDIYPTRDFTMAAIIHPKYPEAGFNFQVGDWRTMNPDEWYTDKIKTGELCQNNGFPIRNWVCHLPVYYEWDKLLSIYDRFDCYHNSYIVENIYFNMEYPDEPQAVNCLSYRDEVRTAHPGISPIGSKMWITNANCGWSQELEEILTNYYDNE